MVEFSPPLIEGRLIARYKRFLFDAELKTGERITGNCPNTGSMLGLTAPGSRIWMSHHSTVTRKYEHQWEIVEADDTMVGVNTGMPNRIAEEAIVAGLIPRLSGYATRLREKRYGDRSRIDILLQDADRPDVYVEVKNVHFSRKRGLAEFPDTRTDRGARHLQELRRMVDLGHRAAMLYVIQRPDCDVFSICDDLDPRYATEFRLAQAHGVEAYAISCRVNERQISADRLIQMR